MASAGRVGVAASLVAVQLVVLYAPRTPSVDPGGVPIDKVVHVAVFALPTAALIWAGVARRWAVAAMVSHALVSEAIQGVAMENRSAEPGDVIADLAGVALGSLAALLPTSRARSPASSEQVSRT